MAPQAEPTGVIPGWTMGDRLRKAREIAELTQAGLSEALDEPRRAIVSYESDERLPKRPVLIAWALRCGVDFSWLAGISDDGGEPTSPNGTKPASIYFHGNESSHIGAA